MVQAVLIGAKLTWMNLQAMFQLEMRADILLHHEHRVQVADFFFDKVFHLAEKNETVHRVQAATYKCALKKRN